MTQALCDGVRLALGCSVRQLRPVSGGDINDAYLAELDDGQRVFIKSKKNAPKGMFVAEAEGLQWLREADALRLPEVIAVSDEEPRFLVLEYLEPASAARGFDERLGRGLAAIHLLGAPAFGWEADNFIGSLRQYNAPRTSWAEFYAEQRLAVQLRWAIDAGKAPPTWQARFDRLFARLPDLVEETTPHRLHGDLWSGNLHRGPNGEPCLIDPAVYAGHREMDLAMMRLFGGFSARVFDAYEEAAPLAEGARARVALYQLYPLLVHVNLFGGSYVTSVEAALHRIL